MVQKRVTDTGVTELAKYENLKDISLTSCRAVTDDVAKEFQNALGSDLSTSGWTKVTDNGVKELPNCNAHVKVPETMSRFRKVPTSMSRLPKVQKLKLRFVNMLTPVQQSIYKLFWATGQKTPKITGQLYNK